MGISTTGVCSIASENEKWFKVVYTYQQRSMEEEEEDGEADLETVENIGGMGTSWP